MAKNRKNTETFEEYCIGIQQARDAAAAHWATGEVRRWKEDLTYPEAHYVQGFEGKTFIILGIEHNAILYTHLWRVFMDGQARWVYGGFIEKFSEPLDKLNLVAA
jgi:hypothetical protein